MPMSCEFLADATERLVTAMRALGVSQEVAGMVAAEWSEGVARDWGGERPYIGKQSGQAAREMSRRDMALLADWHAGERVPILARRYKISARWVRQIILRGTPLP